MAPFPLPSRTPSLLSILALAATLAAQSPFDGKHVLPGDRLAGGGAATVEDCKKWLYTLASPEFEGRGTGQPGFQKAADFVAAHFKSLGLEARGENGTCFQNVPWSESKIDAQKTFLAFARDGKEVLRVPAERLTGSASAALAASGDVVLLVVDAPAAPEGNAQGFAVPQIPGLADLDVKGKVVVAYCKTKEQGPGANAGVRFAVQQGLAGKEAAALLFAQDAKAEGGMRGGRGTTRRTNPAAAGRSRQPLAATFGGDDLDLVLKAGAVDRAVLEGTVLAHPVALQAEVSVVITEGQAPAMNVWAVLPGSDPKRKDEYVVIGSHLDHLGRRGDSYWPGADDDGSGTTGVMAVAQMFAKNPVRPARSILFVCFCGEEDNLVGSGFFAQNCPIPLSAIAAELQMDMIGRDEEENVEGNKGEKAEDNRKSLHLIGTQKLAPALHELCLQKNATTGFEIEYDQEGMFSRSDHANFAKMGVPIAFFFTGLHRDYHRTTDTPDKIHYEKLLRVASYVYDIAFELATASERPMIDPVLWQKYRGKGSEQPAAPMSEPAKEAKKADEQGK